MRIGLFTPIRVSRALGASKNRVEFAEALERQGWQTEVFGAEDIGAEPTTSREAYIEYQQKLRRFLCNNESELDIALVEADTLPFPRQSMPEGMLLVARPAMVGVYHTLISVPQPQFSLARRIAQKAKQVIRPRSLWSKEDCRVGQRITCQNVDLVHALTQWDADALRADGVRKTAIEVIPNGIQSDRAINLRSARAKQSSTTDTKSIVFVGTFDYRKGCLDLAKIMGQLWSRDPDFKLTILGAKGLFQTEQQVRSHFLPEHQNRIKVVMRFDNGELPNLLAAQAIGIFPSYIEGFPFGCLEMIMSGLPTIAFKSPGAEHFVPADLLVNPGDTNASVNLIEQLANDSTFYSQASESCLEAASPFDWDRVADRAARIYQDALDRRRGAKPLEPHFVPA